MPKTKKTSNLLQKKLESIVQAYDNFHNKMLELQKKRQDIYKKHQKASSEKKSKSILEKINKLY